MIGTTEPFERLYNIAQDFLREAQQSGNFIFLDCDLKIDNPQSNILIDRDKTAQLGLKMSDVGGSLAVHARRRLHQLFQHERPLI